MSEAPIFINPPVEGLDTPIYRDTYKDLVKGGHLKGVSYFKFLAKMRERNFGIRRNEFNMRRIDLRKHLNQGEQNA